jgi:hypothetical protein
MWDRRFRLSIFCCIGQAEAPVSHFDEAEAK